MAARSLAQRSLRVLLLEARDRVGGRVWPHAVPGTAAPAELGAEFIHGRAELTKRLLREAGAGIIEDGGEGWVCAGGRLQPEQRDFFEAAGILGAARSLTADESVDQFLNRFSQDERGRETARIARAFVQGFDAADPAIASALAIAEEWESGTDSSGARPRGGYRPLVEHLYTTCVRAGVRIRLSAAVRRIAWRRGTAGIEVDGGSTNQTIQARAAIVTLPAGVLRHRGDGTSVVFDPGLPSAKVQALRYIEMGQVVKVVLRFRTPFWEQVQSGRYRDAGFFRCEEAPFAAFWTQLPMHTPFVTAWAGGPKALAFDDASYDVRIERARHDFGALLQEPEPARSHFEGGLTHDWSRDPLARGAYSYLAVGGMGARQALAAPIDGTLFFAGEATSTNGQSGTVNGALETGERAAEEVAVSLGH
jgi:monoamine oxidase